MIFAEIVLSIYFTVSTTMLSAEVLAMNAKNGPAPPAQTRTFKVHGRVRALDPAQRRIRIAHEEIPGYMSAMTTPFFVKGTDALATLAAGENVQFELVVTKDDAWISHVQKIPEDSACQ